MFARMNKVNIQIKRSGMSKDFSLPVKIGNEPDAEVIINSPLPVYYSILSEDNELKIFDHITNEERTIDSIEELGLSIKPKKTIPKKFLFFLTSLALIAGMSFYLVNQYEQKKSFIEQKVKLLAHQEYNLSLGEVFKSPVGYTPKIKKSQRGFIFNINIEKEKVDHLLSFQIGAIDLKNELSISINSIPIFKSSLEKNCNDQFCREEILIDSVFLRKGENILRIDHHELESFYILQSLKMIELPILSEMEKIDLERLVLNSQRYLKDSHLSDQSLRRARSKIREAKELSSKRKVGAETSLKIKVLFEEIEDKFQKLLKEKRINIQNSITIGDFESAIIESEKLKDLFDLNEYKQRNAVIRTIDQLKKMNAK